MYVNVRFTSNCRKQCRHFDKTMIWLILLAAVQNSPGQTFSFPQHKTSSDRHPINVHLDVNFARDCTYIIKSVNSVVNVVGILEFKVTKCCLGKAVSVWTLLQSVSPIFCQ
jgi:hypothetical protein